MARCALGANQRSRCRRPSLWLRLPLRPIEVPKLPSPDKQGGSKLVAPKNNNSKPGGERLWKSRSVEKSTKRTFPLRLEIRTQRGFPLYAQPRLLLENKNARPRQKGTFLMS